VSEFEEVGGVSSGLKVITDERAEGEGGKKQPFELRNWPFLSWYHHSSAAGTGWLRPVAVRPAVAAGPAVVMKMCMTTRLVKYQWSPLLQWMGRGGRAGSCCTPPVSPSLPPPFVMCMPALAGWRG
jgi:hypothetical protein